MTNLTNKSLEFLSNEELINILQSVLSEIDVAENVKAHRSTTYLAVSAIEGLFGELLKLLMLEPSTVPSWPKDRNGKYLKPESLNNMIEIFDAANALPDDFKLDFYHTLRQYRNYMHPKTELHDLKPIKQSVAQLALACLNALIEKYNALRFVAKQQWRLVYGLAQVPSDVLIHMPPNPGDFVSLLVSEQPAQRFREIKFRVHIPRDSIFNFIYNYSSQNDFMGARIEGREGNNGKGYDNGRIRCTSWRVLSINGRYKSEPKPNEREHTVRVILDPPGTFNLTVDHVQLELEDGVNWDFDPQKKIGFMTEIGLVSIADLEVQTR